MEKLKQAYEALCKIKNTDDVIFEFKDILLASDDTDILKYHLDIIHSCKTDYLKTELTMFFEDRKDKDKILSFLYNTYSESIDNLLRADIIQILGRIEYNCNVRNYHINNHYALRVVKENIANPLRDMRYRSIITTGWIGTQKDISLLNERMLNDIDGQLRGYAATAMRQIWFRLPNAKDEIMLYIKAAINDENDNNTLVGMIVTIQDMYRKKLGIKESNYGDISGNVITAKEKSIKFLSKL